MYLRYLVGLSSRRSLRGRRYLPCLGWPALAIVLIGMPAGIGAPDGCLFLTGTAHAGPTSTGTGEAAAKEAAKEHSRAGSIHYNLRHYGEAIEDYSQAYRLYPAPELLFNLGQCHRGLGDHVSAITLYRNYLRQKPDASNRRTVEQLIAESQEALAQSRAHPALGPDMLSSDSYGLGTPAMGGASGKPPLYERWWFWTLVGSAALTAGGTAYYLRQHDPAIPTGTLGWLDRR